MILRIPGELILLKFIDGDKTRIIVRMCVANLSSGMHFYDICRDSLGLHITLWQSRGSNMIDFSP